MAIVTLYFATSLRGSPFRPAASAAPSSTRAAHRRRQLPSASESNLSRHSHLQPPPPPLLLQTTHQNGWGRPSGHSRTPPETPSGDVPAAAIPPAFRAPE